MLKIKKSLNASNPNGETILINKTILKSFIKKRKENLSQITPLPP
jgi:hypothetical protein